MSDDRYFFTEEMNQQYMRLAIEAAKEGALLESVRDVAFLYEARAWFIRNGGGETAAGLSPGRGVQPGGCLRRRCPWWEARQRAA